MINSLEHEHALKASIAVGARFAAKARPLMIEPRVYYMLIEPEGEATTIAKSFVILRPVTDAVLLLFLSHKLNITALPRPCYLCSNASCAA